MNPDSARVERTRLEISIWSRKLERETKVRAKDAAISAPPSIWQLVGGLRKEIVKQGRG